MTNTHTAVQASWRSLLDTVSDSGLVFLIDELEASATSAREAKWPDRVKQCEGRIAEVCEELDLRIHGLGRGQLQLISE